MQKKMRSGLVAKKMGMMRFFDESGGSVPVTVLKVDKTVVLAHRTVQKNGYCALVLGVTPEVPERLKKPQRAFMEQKGFGFFRTIREFRVSEDQLLPEGSVLSVEHFAKDSWIDVSGVTIGKGFAGVMKRHNFGGLRASHGVSVSHRSHGSTGQRQDPGKVFKNKKMAGHMGHKQITQQNLRIFGVDSQRALIFLKGSVPGCDGGMLFLSDAVKKQGAVS